MKSLQITSIIACLLIVFLSSGVVSAINSDDLTATVNFSTETVKAGETLFVRITVTSNMQQVQIQAIGINFDWNDQDFFYGPIVSSNPQTLAVNESYISDPIMIQVPYNVTNTVHNYHVGIEGKDASGNDFSWDGPTGTITTGAGGGVTTPTPTTIQSGDGEGETSPQNWTLYIAIMAVAAIVIAVLIIVLEMRKKPEKLAPIAGSTRPLSESPKPEADKPNPANDQPLKDIEE